MRRYRFIFISIIISIFISGCGDVQIFKKKTDKYAQIELSDTELKTDVYYVKDGIKFIALYDPSIKTISQSSSFNYVGRNDIAYMQKDIRLVPSAYAGDYIAYKTNDSKKRAFDITRYRYIGYSIGIYGGYFTDEGFYAAEIKTCVADNSSLKTEIGNTPADTIRIVKINDKIVLPEMCDPYTGVFAGLEEGGTYKLCYYLGSNYYEKDIIADTAFLNSFESYSYDESVREENVNGYFNFEIPSDIKSGWYYITNLGFFKYYEFEKGTHNAEEANMNASYYENEEDRILSYTRQYSVSVPQKSRNVKFDLSYTESEYDGVDTILGSIISPSGKTYVMDVDSKEHRIFLELSEAIPGEYKINIYPKTLTINSVKAESTTEDQELTQTERDISINEDTTNKIFRVYYENKDSDVFASVISPDGSTYNMVPKQATATQDQGENTHWLEYEMPYVSAGTYTVRAYYYSADNKILDITIEDNIETETDVIIIEN